MDVHISPAIYRLVIQHFSDPSVNCPVQDRIEDYCYDADKWVDCWVGCAAVIVQNGRRVSAAELYGELSPIRRDLGLVALLVLGTSILGAYQRLISATACRPPFHVQASALRSHRISGKTFQLLAIQNY